MKNPNHSPKCLCDQCVPMRTKILSRGEPRRPIKYDLRVEGRSGDTIYLLRPLTAAGSDWIDEHIVGDASLDPGNEVTFFGGAVVVEHRYIQNIVQGAMGDGLKVQ
jgi:hypothetical protein